MSNQDLATLKEMGFSTNKAMKALAITGNQGVEVALEWLLAHGEELENLQDHPTVSSQTFPESRINASSAISSAPLTQEKLDPPNECEAAGESICVGTPFGQPNEPTQAHEEAGQGEAASPKDSIIDHAQLNDIKKFKCDKCGLVLTTSEMEKHAKETGHTQFVENVTLSEEDKKKQLIKLAEKIKQKRMEREALEKEEELLREKNRIKSGKEISAAKKRLEEAEMKKLLKHGNERNTNKVAREKIKQQIEEDRRARRVKFGNVSGEQSTSSSVPSSSTSTATSASISSPVSNKSSTSTSTETSKTKIQIRLLNGNTIQENFGSKEQLSCVRLFIDFYRTDGTTPYDLMTNFPKRVYADEDYEKPLDSLNLTPSAVLIMIKKQDQPLAE